MWILALDVGTSSIRAIGYDALGRPLPGADARVGCEPTTTQVLADALGVAIEGTLVSPDPRRRDIYAAARARQSRPYDSVVGPRVS